MRKEVTWTRNHESNYNNNKCCESYFQTRTAAVLTPVLIQFRYLYFPG